MWSCNYEQGALTCGRIALLAAALSFSSCAGHKDLDHTPLDPVLADLGVQRMTSASVELLRDFGAWTDEQGNSLTSGGVAREGMTWHFEDPSPLLQILLRAQSQAFKRNRWPGADAFLLIRGQLEDGESLQITLHSKPGWATLTKETRAGQKQGGEWHFDGGEKELIGLLRELAPR